jgi:Zn-dependent peptidase ImmA (M78 family)/transcriptional regulator with XRE-family HTH domain
VNTLDPKTLQTARLARGFSLKSLGGLSGISAPTISRIESGKREATEQELHSLAEAVSLPWRALTRSLVSEQLGLSAFYHRKLSRAGAKAVRSIESLCMLNAVVIKNLIGMIDTPLNQNFISIDLDDAKGDPSVAANMVRLAWKVPSGPIDDLISLVEKFGCLVIHTDFNIPEMDALYQKIAGAPPIFWVNSRKPLDRVRFSIAHELGHLILHDERPTDNQVAEKQANEFAAAFLMPKSDFQSECPSRLHIPQLIEMKRRWRCSMSAIARRAKDVGRITSDREYTNLMITLSKRGWRKSEPYPLSGETPRLLADTIRQCLDDCELTVSELAETLAAAKDDLISWSQPFPSHDFGFSNNAPKLRFVPGPDSNHSFNLAITQAIE